MVSSRTSQKDARRESSHPELLQPSDRPGFRRVCAFTGRLAATSRVVSATVRERARSIGTSRPLDGGDAAAVYWPPSRTGGSSGTRATRPAATSACAVVITLSVPRSTRGMQPRINCAARRPLTTANSNGLEPTGRLIPGDPFVLYGGL